MTYFEDILQGMKIFLVRHGQSRWQVERNNSDLDTPLTYLGQEQAQLLSWWLAEGGQFDGQSRVEMGRLCASPMVRAQETAVHTAKLLKQPIITLKSLHESSFYIGPHLPKAASPYQHPIYEPTDLYEEFKEQARTALYELIAQAEDGNGTVLAVAHGGLISTLLRTAVQSDTVSFWIYNTSINLIEWKRGRWHLVHLNLWEHLPLSHRTF